MNDSNVYLVYKLSGKGVRADVKKRDGDFVQLRPTLRNVLKYAAHYRPLLAWFFFHCFRVFYNRSFSMICYLKDDEMIHRSCVFPGFYKFPFMNKNDLQLGEIWTHEDARRKGVATRAIGHLLSLDCYEGRAFWYVVKENNADSIRLAERFGFSLYCRAQKKSRMGVSFLGRYELTSL